MSGNHRNQQDGEVSSMTPEAAVADAAPTEDRDTSTAAAESRSAQVADFPKFNADAKPRKAAQYIGAIGPHPSHPEDDNRRRRERIGFHSPVALVLIDLNGHCRSPLVLQAEDLAAGGLCLRSASMIHPGTAGAVQMVRSDGGTMIQGVIVRWCRYVGEMKHLIGLEFQQAHPAIGPSHFKDEQGRTVLFDPRWLTLWGQCGNAA